jgi:hypothetical protein
MTDDAFAQAAMEYDLTVYKDFLQTGGNRFD